MSDNPAALNYSDQQNHNRDEQQEVNKAAERVGTDYADQPKGQQENENEYQHVILLSRLQARHKVSS